MKWNYNRKTLYCASSLPSLLLCHLPLSDILQSAIAGEISQYVTEKSSFCNFFREQRCVAIKFPMII